MRTTIDIDDPILRDLKRVQRQEKTSLGRLVSDLLAQALGRRGSGRQPVRRFQWNSQPMGARIDLSDKDALFAALEEPKAASRTRRPRR